MTNKARVVFKKMKKAPHVTKHAGLLWSRLPLLLNSKLDHYNII